MDSLIPIAVQFGKQGSKDAILEYAERTNVVIQNLLINLKSLRDLYDISTCSQFEPDTFFPTDSFNIPAEKTDEARKAVEPIARRIILFFNDHPIEKFQTVIAYSSTSADQQRNDTLCKLRARSVANLLLNQIKSNEAFILRPEWIHYNIKWMAERKVLPNPVKEKHPKPKPKAKRRGMISLIWNMLPVSLYAGSSDK